MDLSNQRGVITGAGSGIGRVLALELGRRRADLLLVGRRPGPLEETAAWSGTGTRKPTCCRWISPLVTPPAGN